MPIRSRSKQEKDASPPYLHHWLFARRIVQLTAEGDAWLWVTGEDVIEAIKGGAALMEHGVVLGAVQTPKFQRIHRPT